MNFTRALLFVTAVSTPVFAEYLRIEPALPDSSDQVVAEFGGVWRDGCIPNSPSVIQRGNNEIAIVLQTPVGPCPAATTPWESRATIAPLPPGVYTLLLEVVATPPVSQPRATLTFPVSEANASFTLTPKAGPSAGGTDVFVSGSLGSCPFVPPCHDPQVLFGGVAATSVKEVSGGVIATTPAHSPGTVDVEIRGRAGTTLAVLRSAFTFQGPGSPHPANYTPVLIPLIFQGPGAFGSEWVTTAMGYNDSDVAVTPLNHVVTNCPPNVSPCPLPLFAPRVWDSFHHGVLYPTGVILWLPRDQDEDLHFSLRVRDRSRSDDNDGTDIPVVREKELLREVHLLDVPLRAGFRHTIRIYDLGFSEGRRVTVTAFGPFGETLATSSATLVAERENCLGGPVGCIPSFPRFASLSDFVSSDLPGVDRMRLEIRPSDPGMRLWAFVSITNNVTQQITTVTPE